MSTIKQRHISYSINQYLPIHRQRGHRALYGASQDGKVEVVRLLLDRGADIEASRDVNHTSNSTQQDQSLCKYHSEWSRHYDSNNNRSASSSNSSSSSSDDKYSLSLLRQPVTKYHQFDDNIVQ
jgi:hypothetical protein